MEKERKRESARKDEKQSKIKREREEREREREREGGRGGVKKRRKFLDRQIMFRMPRMASSIFINSIFRSVISQESNRFTRRYLDSSVAQFYK